MIILRRTMNVLPKNQKEVSQTLLSMIEPMGTEKGCLSYDVFCDMEDENIHNLIEEWETREDLDRQIASKKFRVLLGAENLLNKPFLEQPNEIHIKTGRKVICSPVVCD
jgi:quinol monooxygenase YgiN